MTIADLEKRFALDGALKQTLRESGDDENVDHAIDHHFIAAREESLNELAACAVALGFGHSAVSEREDQGQPYWYFDVLSQRDTKMPSLMREAILMVALAEAFNAVYDGWGTMIEDNGQPPRPD